jgi:hypothetical protein
MNAIPSKKQYKEFSRGPVPMGDAKAKIKTTKKETDCGARTLEIKSATRLEVSFLFSVVDF